MTENTLAYLYNQVNPFHVTNLFLYPMKTSENQRGFLMFLGGIERGQWHEMS